MLLKPLLIGVLHAHAHERAHLRLRLGILEDDIAREREVAFLDIEDLDEIDLALVVSSDDLLHLVEIIEEVADEDDHGSARDVLAVLIHGLEEVGFPLDTQGTHVIEEVCQVGCALLCLERVDVFGEDAHVEAFVVAVRDVGETKAHLRGVLELGCLLAEVHGCRAIDENVDHEVPLRFESSDVELVGARVDTPVDVAEVVAGRVWLEILEYETLSAVARLYLPRDYVPRCTFARRQYRFVDACHPAPFCKQ